MKSEVISDAQGISLIVMFLGGTTSLLTLGISAKQDFWIAILLAVAISVPVYLMFARLHKSFPGKNLFDIIELCFGKIIGKILILLFTLFCLDEGTEVIINMAQFTNSTFLSDTPRIVLTISMILLGIWAVKQGIEVFGRWARIVCIPFCATIIISVLLLIPSMDINNMLPVFNQDVQSIFKGTYLTFSFPFGEIFAISIIFSRFRTPKTSYKVYMSGLFIGMIIPLLLSASNVLVLGTDDAAAYFHPAYFALRRIALGNFLQRIEVLSSVVYLLGSFVKVTIYLFAISIGVSKLFQFDDHRFIVIPAGLIIMNLSYFYFVDMLAFWEYAEKVWVYYAIPMETVIPLLIFVVAEIRKKKLVLSEKMQC